MGITLARETAGGIRSVGWFEETENRLNKDRPTQFWTRLDRMTESVAIAERPSSCCDELRTLGCTYFAIGSRENRVAENGIGPAPVIPEQTGLRNHYCANQIKYQKPSLYCHGLPPTLSSWAHRMPHRGVLYSASNRPADLSKVIPNAWSTPQIPRLHPLDLSIHVRLIPCQ